MLVEVLLRLIRAALQSSNLLATREEISGEHRNADFSPPDRSKVNGRFRILNGLENLDVPAD
jgi:hypothetical protein